MLSKIIGFMEKKACKLANVPQDIVGTGKFGNLKIALFADYHTSICLSAECRVRNFTADNYKEIITGWRPDLVFVESSFHCLRKERRCRIIKKLYAARHGQDSILPGLLAISDLYKIPALFWNKHDARSFGLFLDIASHFEYIFAADATCLSRYWAILPSNKNVNAMPVAYQPAFHDFAGFHFKSKDICFIGSNYKNILDTHGQFLEIIFDAANAAAFPVNIYCGKAGSSFSRYFECSYPKRFPLIMRQAVPCTSTSSIYKDHLVSLYVNPASSSGTMFSSRLLEILACGGIMVTNFSPAVEREFLDFCHIVRCKADAVALFRRLNRGPSQDDLDRAEAGANYVRQNHSWTKRLEQIAEVINFGNKDHEADQNTCPGHACLYLCLQWLQCGGKEHAKAGGGRS